MKHKYLQVILLSLLPLSLIPGQKVTISPQEFAQRRQAVLAQLDSNSAACFAAAEPLFRNDDVPYPYRQNSSLLYLTGLKEQNAVLFLFADEHVVFDSIRVRQMLFVPQKRSSWLGALPTFEERKQRIGFFSPTEIILPLDSLPSVLANVLPTLRVLYYTPSLQESFTDPVARISYISWREAKKQLEAQFPNLEVRKSSALLENLRSVKSPTEIRLIQEAVDRTIAIHRELMKMCKPGLYEYELQAWLQYTAEKRGIESLAFPPIVATGKNALYPHYSGKNSRLQTGELLLVDCGVENEGYAADLTRTFPVSGKFTPPQKALYELVLSARDSGLAVIQPGETLRSIHARMHRVIAEGLVKLGIISSTEQANTFTLHGFCHFLGLDVHDGGSDTQVLEPGMVFAIEPAVYIPDSPEIPFQYRGIAIRVEDNVVITENGCTLLSALAPTSIEEIEETIKKVSQSSKPRNQ